MGHLNVDTTVGGNQRYSFIETPLEMHPSSHQKDLSSPPADQTAPPQHHAGEEPPKERPRPWSYAPSEKEQFQNQGIIPDNANCPPLEQHPANYAPLVQNQQHQQHQQQQLQRHHNTSMSPQTYAVAPEHQQHAAPVYAQPYTTQQYTNIAEQQSRTMSPQAYANHSYTNIPEQQQHQWHQQIGMTISPQYANIPEQQHNTPMSPNSYASHPCARQSYTHIPDQQRGIEQPQQYASYTEPPSPPPNSPGPLPVKVNPEAPTRSETLPIAPDENPLQSPKSPYFPPPTRAATSHTPQPDDLGAYHQPGQTTHPNQEIKGGGWSNGLCEFSNFGICCLGLFCPCILYGRTQHRLSVKSRKEDPTNMLGYETCNGSCTAMGLLCGCQWLLATVQHSRTRKTYGIQGSIASDCVRATCCTCCTLIQDEKEIQKREEYRSRVARERGATLLSSYTTPGPMSYGPPR
ncbi:unnamed protein product [Penicillium nalgiovense]|uniref:DUF614 domain protein n=1 Tax=Penicillium nalgiovense TaxID=60175 RepID=A0A9W4MZD8_PENNA|nr:unnamed protein product [Penicillium nalgiovense]CAG7937991.1 unnamed protein product [Penicillium nalgiovense]CAG7940306.1 unnamed protein product [Penicillium nalgiovense]CAG7955286.1 unnamed protein product [Penicillium nalgiovense]CAG7957434.1 unnamed protein product [Penicillium nalgiovense]